MGIYRHMEQSFPMGVLRARTFKPMMGAVYRASPAQTEASPAWQNTEPGTSTGCPEPGELDHFVEQLKRREARQ